jgi:hypothetical protein
MKCPAIFNRERRELNSKPKNGKLGLSGARVAAQHCHERQSALADRHPPVVWRFAWPPEGNTLVIDVTNFSPRTDFRGSRENLHLVERWSRTG